MNARSLVGLLALFVLGITGCASNQVRYMTATRWSESQDGKRTYYLTYYEGTCSNGFLGFNKGCREGDSKVRRCNLQPDNSLTCVDESEANKALAKK